MSYEWMLRHGFPLEHIMAMHDAPPGASVTTDHTGTRVHIPSGAVFPARAGRAVDGRYFDPLFSTAWTGPATPATLIRYDPANHVSNTLYSTVYTPTELEAMFSTIAIFVDGACRNNGKDTARAGYGVFFGDGSKYNTKGLVDCGKKQTSQVAEIIAALKALEVLNEVWKNVGLMEVVLVTDSDYVAKSMCEYIWKWQKNGFKTRKGKKVENEGLLRMLNERIDDLKENGLEVKFWRVDRSMNKEADGLANEALDLLSGREAL
ncbi:ribonuclease H-like domain-containing protein [Morchella snyderi]|nr:ribonuclease H-like domain-containing protein [Morchella snyderi]